MVPNRTELYQNVKDILHNIYQYVTAEKQESERGLDLLIEEQTQILVAINAMNIAKQSYEEGRKING